MTNLREKFPAKFRHHIYSFYNELNCFVISKVWQIDPRESWPEIVLINVKLVFEMKCNAFVCECTINPRSAVMYIN